MKYECDARTTAWFKLQPKGHVTTLMKCERCGLMYKSSLGHECPNIEVVDETPKPKALSYEEVLHLKNEAIIISTLKKAHGKTVHNLSSPSWTRTTCLWKVV